MPLLLRGQLAWAHKFVTNPALSAAFETLAGTSIKDVHARSIKGSAGPLCHQCTVGAVN
jgi:hypothetical protein